MNQVLEGTWTEVSQLAARINGNARVRLEVHEEQPKGRIMQFGALPTKRELTEEDFKSAEFRPKLWEA